MESQRNIIPFSTVFCVDVIQSPELNHRAWVILDFPSFSVFQDVCPRHKVSLIDDEKYLAANEQGKKMIS